MGFIEPDELPPYKVWAGDILKIKSGDETFILIEVSNSTVDVSRNVQVELDALPRIIGHLQKLYDEHVREEDY